MKKSTLALLSAAAIMVTSGVAVANNYYHDGYHNMPGPGYGYGRQGRMGMGWCDAGGFNNRPRGFGLETKEYTVKQILSDGKEDEIIRVKGRLTKYLGEEKFELTDSNNDTIIVELDDDRNWDYIEKDMPIEIIAKIDDEKVTKILEVKFARPDFGDAEANSPRNKGPRGFENKDVKSN